MKVDILALFLNLREESFTRCDVNCTFFFYWCPLSSWNSSLLLFFFFKIFYLFIFRERGKEGEREGYKHQCVRDTSPTGELAHNSGMCGGDWELNWLPFGLQANAQSAEPQQPGVIWFLKELERRWFLGSVNLLLLFYILMSWYSTITNFY